MDLQGALQQLQAHVRTQVEIVLTNLAAVATREHYDEALYNRFLGSRQSIPIIYGQMLGWSNQLNNLSFAQGLQSLAEALNTITLDVDASLQTGIDETRKQSLINGVTNADAVMSAFLQQHYATIIQYYSTQAAQSPPAPSTEEPPPAPLDDGDLPPPPPEDDSPFDTPADIVDTPAPSQPTAQVPSSALPTIVTQLAPASASTQPTATTVQPTSPASSPTLQRTTSSLAMPRVPWSGALNDLIASEQEYIQLLTGAANAYDLGFKTNLVRMKKLLSESDLGSIQALFSGLSLISKCHSQFLTHVEAARAGTEPLGGAIKTMVITLKVYTDYMTNLDNNIEILRKARKNKDFTKFLESECKPKSGSNQEVETICAHTYKRLAQYDGLINAFLVNMTSNDPDYNELKESQVLVRKVAEYIAQARSAMDIRNKIIVIQQRVVSLPQGLNLVAPHRVLLRELDMDVRAHDAKKPKEMTVYAFNDMILLTRIKGLVSKEEVCEAIISYHDHRIESANENDRGVFRMVESKKGSGFSFYPPDDSVKAQWLSEIRSAIEQLKNSRATALVDQVDENELQTKLQVRIMAGRDVIISLYEPPDLYVQVALLHGSVVSNMRRGSVKEKCRFNPEWEDRFVLPVKNPFEEILSLEVKEKNSDSLIGSTSIPLDDLYDHVEKQGWFRLKSDLPSHLEPEIFLSLMVAPNLTE